MAASFEPVPPAENHIEQADPVDNELEDELENDVEQEENNEPGEDNDINDAADDSQAGAVVKNIDFSQLATGQQTVVRVSYNNLIHAVDLTRVVTGKDTKYANEVCISKICSLEAYLSARY